VTRIRIAFLGPAGTFSEDALRAATGEAEFEAIPRPTVYAAIRAVAESEADRALVPFENSIEGSVRSTLDTLALEVKNVTIAGEHDHPIRNSLIARTELPLDQIEVVLSHPQASAQCARFLREHLPAATVRAAASTADAVRQVAASEEPWAALGAASAARIYDAVVLREGVEDEDDNVTRFIWIAPAGTKPEGPGPWRTTLVFAELGADHPGALVEALTEFSSRDVNLTRIESRPLRQGLGRYMFFCDLEGAEEAAPVAEAIAALRNKAESVRVLGSYPISTRGIPVA
jgi:prephenate dehydratase